MSAKASMTGEWGVVGLGGGGTRSAFDDFGGLMVHLEIVVEGGVFLNTVDDGRVAEPDSSGAVVVDVDHLA